MRFSLIHKLVTYLISGLGLYALSLGTELSGLSLTAIAIGYVASFFAEGELLNRTRYASGWTLAVVLFLAVQVGRAALAEPTLAMAIEFAAFLQISRLFNRRTAADHQQIAVLAFLHLIAATVLSSSLSYAAVFIGFVVATPWMLALSNLRREIETNYSASREPEAQTRASIRRVLASKRVVGPGFLLGTAALALPLFLMTLAIFIVVPRVGKGFFGLQRDKSQRVTGFGNLIELGGFGLIRDDPTVVLRVTPLPKAQRRAPRAAFRMRGTSFDHYDGKRWTRTPADGEFYPEGLAFYPITRWPHVTRDRQLRVVLERLEEKVVFLPRDAVALSMPWRRTVKGEQVGPRLVRSRGLDIRYVDDESLGLVYTAYVNSDTRSAVCPGLSAAETQLYLQMPPGHQAVVALARDIARGATTGAQKAERIMAYLRDSGAYRYSLQQPEVGDTAPLEAFLLRAKTGHCEYFSSAMAIMLRAVGVPTRNVTGFLGGRYNPFGDYYAVRQGDAHSWVEAFVQGRGWVTYDPTPPARVHLGPGEGAWANVYALIDALRTRWMTSVVAYDLQTQVGMLRKLARWLSRLRSDSRHEAVPEKDGDPSWPIAPSRLVVLLAAIAALLLLAFAVRRWRQRRAGKERRPLSRRASEAVDLYHELERVLSRCGHPRSQSATPWEHAEQLAREGFADSDTVRQVTQRYMEVRYGDDALSGEELRQLRSRIAAIRPKQVPAERRTA